MGILLVVCRSAAPRWRAIGIHLGIDVAELDIIRSNPELIVEGVEGYFQEMLTMWLKQAPPKHQLPCLESLAYALRNVREERLAMELPESFLQAKGNLCAVCSFIPRLSSPLFHNCKQRMRLYCMNMPTMHGYSVSVSLSFRMCCIG